MARDWRKVALAVVAAVALAPACALVSGVKAQQVAKADAKADTKADKGPSAQTDDDGDDTPHTKVAAKTKRQNPAEAQRLLDSANKQLQAGKAELAAQSLTVVLAGGNLPPAIMARAFYLRGIAHRQQGKPAQAISDLTSALWLKGGLAAEDRQEALKQRSGAFADAGLTENGQTAAGPAATKDASPRPAPTKGWGVTTTPTAAAPENSTQTAQGGNWFKNWFGNWSSKQPGPPATASIDKSDAPAPTAHATPASPRVGSAWSSNTQVETPAAPPPKAAHAPAGKSAASHATGKYRVQLATVRSQQEAVALAAKAKRALAGDLAREPEIDQAVLGNMGAFYRVRVGPFATVQETQAVCAKIKGTGFDCMTVTQ